MDVLHTSSYRWFYLALGRLLNRYADAAVAVGTDVAGARTAQGYRTVEMVHGGVDGGRYSAWRADHPGERAALVKQLGGDIECLGVIVGGLRAVKRQQTAIEAAAVLGPSVGLIVVGTGPEERALRDLARSSAARVLFTGQVPDAWKFIASADTLVHTSKYEGLPVVLMEAAALETPIVATPFHGAREVRETGAQVSISASSSAEDVADAWRRVTPNASATRRKQAADYWGVGRFVAEFYAVVDHARDETEKEFD